MSKLAPTGQSQVIKQFIQSLELSQKFLYRWPLRNAIGIWKDRSLSLDKVRSPVTGSLPGQALCQMQALANSSPARQFDNVANCFLNPSYRSEHYGACPLTSLPFLSVPLTLPSIRVRMNKFETLSSDRLRRDERPA